jgi:hypothetical protein
MTPYDELHELVKSDPERAWPEVLAFIHDYPDLSAEAQDLVEDFVYEHDERFISSLESAAEDPAMRAVIEKAYVGGFATVGAERFHALQERLRASRSP